MATNADPNPASAPKPSVFLQDMDEVKKVFNKFDANGDGKISAAELVHVMKALGSDTSDDEVKRMMDVMDTDHDGFVSLDEFANFCKGDASGANGDDGLRELKEAFELYDQDKNGLISKAELHQILTRLGERCSVGDCSRMIKTVDSDGDGYVSFEEFTVMMTNTVKKANSSSSK